MDRRARQLQEYSERVEILEWKVLRLEFQLSAERELTVALKNMVKVSQLKGNEHE